MNFERPNEFPSKQEQLDRLRADEEIIKENLHLFNIDEKEVEDLIKGLPLPDHVPEEKRGEISKEIEKLRNIKIRKDYLEKGESSLPSIPPEAE